MPVVKGFHIIAKPSPLAVHARRLLESDGARLNSATFQMGDWAGSADASAAHPGLADAVYNQSCCGRECRARTSGFRVPQ